MRILFMARCFFFSSTQPNRTHAQCCCTNIHLYSYINDILNHSSLVVVVLDLVGIKLIFMSVGCFSVFEEPQMNKKKSIQPNLRVNKRGLSLMCKCICNVSKKVSEHKRQQNWEWKKLQTTKKQAKFLSFPLKDYDWFMIKFYRHKIKSLSWLLLFRSVQDSEVDRVNGEYLVNRVQ